MDWRQYERQIYDLFCRKYPDAEILFDQMVLGRHSKIPRQVDMLVKFQIVEVAGTGVFDCKCYSQNVDVQTIDYMVGYLDDVGATLGGVVTTMGFSEGARNRARAASIDLRTIEFQTLEQLVEQLTPKLDFSDRRNSMYIPLM